MGLSPCAHWLEDTENVVDKNPDPSSFKILFCKEVGNFVLAKIKYYGCTNYEGMKILVFEGVTSEEIKNRLRIDPHFDHSDTKYSPIARFAPSLRGIELALQFCEKL